MAVSSETYKNIYTGDGSTTDFDYNFRILQAADLKVIKYTISGGSTETLTLSSDYNVYDVGVASGGYISLDTAPSSDYKIIIMRDADYTQETDFVENDPFLADTIEDTLDKLTMLTQQLLEQVDRSVLQDESVSSQVTFPSLSSGFLYSDGSSLSFETTGGEVLAAGTGIDITDDQISVDLTSDEFSLGGDLDAGSNKITSLADGVDSGDAVNKGQLDGAISGAEAIPSGVITIWSGAISDIPSGWVICDGNNDTPNLTDRFVIHADADSGGTRDVGDTGGAHTHTLTEAEIPSHRHSYINSTSNFSLSSKIRTAPDTGGTGYTNYTGGGEAHNNMPKYYALAYIQKT
jgi:hypothetical protein